MPRRRHHRRPPLPRPTVYDVEPEDVPRVFEEGEFEADAQPSEAVEAASAEPSEPPASIEDEAEAPPSPDRDTGLLYGVHEPPAVETELAAGEDHDAFRGADLGESFAESLVEKSTEYGPTPEHELDIDDESDPHAPPPRTDHRDRPKADRGSGGIGGL